LPARKRRGTQWVPTQKAIGNDTHRGVPRPAPKISSVELLNQLSNNAAKSQVELR